MHRTRAAPRGRLYAGARLSLILCAAAACVSCGLFAPEMTVLVHMPEPPPHWRRAFAGLSARVLYLGGDGRPREAACGQWGQSVRIACAKLQNSPVLAFPRARTGLPEGGEEELPPAGALFPMSLGGTGDSLELAWRDGCAALTAWKAWSQGVDLSAFDAPRLAAEMRDAGDPWSWDSTSIAEAIVGGEFTSRDIDPLPCLDVRVCPGPGEWFLESPCAAPAPVEAGEELLLPSVPGGMHTLFSAGGARVRIFVGGERVVIGLTERW
jgi:hypothetical protein